MFKLGSGRVRSRSAAQNFILKFSGWLHLEAPGTSLSDCESLALNRTPVSRQGGVHVQRARAPRGAAHLLRVGSPGTAEPLGRAGLPGQSAAGPPPVLTGHTQSAPGAHFSHSSSRFRNQQVESRRHACPGENATHKVPLRGGARLEARARKPHPETGFLVSCRPLAVALQARPGLGRSFRSEVLT